MNAPLIPRLPELPLDEFDAEYRRAEVDHRDELKKLLPEFESAVGAAPVHAGDFFSGGSGTVLDVGCGTGTLPFLLAQYNPAASVIGVDISAESIAYANQHYAPRAANLEYRVAGVDDLGSIFHDIDMITCVGALHHFPSLESATAQITQVLGDGGAFVLSDLNRENIHAHFSDKELRFLDSVRRLPEKARNNKLRRHGYTRGMKMRRFLTLMSFQAAYTPAEVSQALGSRFGFKGKMAGVNYLLVAYRL